MGTSFLKYLEAFLGSVESTTRRHNVFSPSQLSLNEYRICSNTQPYCLDVQSIARFAYPTASPID